MTRLVKWNLTQVWENKSDIHNSGNYVRDCETEYFFFLGEIEISSKTTIITYSILLCSKTCKTMRTFSIVPFPRILQILQFEVPESAPPLALVIGRTQVQFILCVAISHYYSSPSRYQPATAATNPAQPPWVDLLTLCLSFWHFCLHLCTAHHQSTVT